MSTYIEYVVQVVTEFEVDLIKVPHGSEPLFEGVGVTVEPDPGVSSFDRVVEFYASGVLVARAKLP